MPPRAPRSRSLFACGPTWCLLAIVVLLLGGCSLGVMAGKMLTGDPMLPAQFKQMTHTDLVKNKNKVVVICSTPTAIDAELGGLNLDLIDGITRRMKVHGIQVVNPDAVAQWIDDNGGVITDPSEMARAFDADYVAWIDVSAFTLKEPNAPKLLRGHTEGFIRVFQVEKIDDDKVALAKYNAEFTVTYPPHQPLSETGRSAVLFQKEFIDRVCEQLAETFYDHRPGANI